MLEEELAFIFTTEIRHCSQYFMCVNSFDPGIVGIVIIPILLTSKQRKKVECFPKIINLADDSAPEVILCAHTCSLWLLA